ncbi:MAG: ABC transporter permease subunit [Oscillospiraceae bacterium]|nr:ABC transporter permease subunit [Oscillospiraceae bacterium]
MVKQKSNILMSVFRVFLVIAFVAAFIPDLNPARLSEIINRNASLFTSAISYDTVGRGFERALDREWIYQSTLVLTYVGAIVCMLAVGLVAAAFCMSLGNTRLKRRGLMASGGAALLGAIGIIMLFVAQAGFEGAPNPDRIAPMFPIGIYAFIAIFAALLVVSAAMWFILPQPSKEEDDKLSIEPKYSLFLMVLPFLVLVVLFAYLPLWGWRYAFFDYTPGFALAWEDFVGFKWFTSLFENAATRRDIVRVMTNTFALSGIGIATSWVPIVFAIFLSELRSNPFKRTVQTLTTIPNYISWVLVYSVAFALFSTEGFFNWMLISLGFVEEGKNFLIDGENMWFKMWAWGTWKGLGWGAIIYLASISSIDPQLYEAAMVDGAGRYRRMWHITVPGLMPTYFVLLLLSIANMLSNGLEQYLVFSNPATSAPIEVLDLYVFNLGIGDGGNIPLATMIGMLKSVISVVLLFAANKASKLIRGESIV